MAWLDRVVRVPWVRADFKKLERLSFRRGAPFSTLLRVLFVQVHQQNLSCFCLAVARGMYCWIMVKLSGEKPVVSNERGCDENPLTFLKDRIESACLSGLSYHHAPSFIMSTVWQCSILKIYFGTTYVFRVCCKVLLILLARSFSFGGQRFVARPLQSSIKVAFDLIRYSQRLNPCKEYYTYLRWGVLTFFAKAGFLPCSPIQHWRL